MTTTDNAATTQRTRLAWTIAAALLAAVVIAILVASGGATTASSATPPVSAPDQAYTAQLHTEVTRADDVTYTYDETIIYQGPRDWTREVTANSPGPHLPGPIPPPPGSGTRVTGDSVEIIDPPARSVADLNMTDTELAAWVAANDDVPAEVAIQRLLDERGIEPRTGAGERIALADDEQPLPKRWFDLGWWATQGAMIERTDNGWVATIDNADGTQVATFDTNGYPLTHEVLDVDDTRIDVTVELTAS